MPSKPPGIKKTKIKASHRELAAALKKIKPVAPKPTLLDRFFAWINGFRGRA